MYRGAGGRSLKLALYLWSGPDSTLCGEEKISGFSLGNDRENVWRRKNFGVFHQFSAFFIIFRGAKKKFRGPAQR